MQNLSDLKILDLCILSLWILITFLLKHGVVCSCRGSDVSLTHSVFNICFHRTYHFNYYHFSPFLIFDKVRRQV